MLLPSLWEDNYLPDISQLSLGIVDQNMYNYSTYYMFRMYVLQINQLFSFIFIPKSSTWGGISTYNLKYTVMQLD